MTNNVEILYLVSVAIELIPQQISLHKLNPQRSK